MSENVFKNNQVAVAVKKPRGLLDLQPEPEQEVQQTGPNVFQLLPPPSVPRAAKWNKNVFSPKYNLNNTQQMTISPQNTGAAPFKPYGYALEENIYDTGDLSMKRETLSNLKLPPIGKNYQNPMGATNNVYKKDKIKMARSIAKGELLISEVDDEELNLETKR